MNGEQESGFRAYTHQSPTLTVAQKNTFAKDLKTDVAKILVAGTLVGAFLYGISRSLETVQEMKQLRADVVATADADRSGTTSLDELAGAYEEMGIPTVAQDQYSGVDGKPLAFDPSGAPTDPHKLERTYTLADGTPIEKLPIPRDTMEAYLKKHKAEYNARR